MRFMCLTETASELRSEGRNLNSGGERCHSESGTFFRAFLKSWWMVWITLKKGSNDMKHQRREDLASWGGEDDDVRSNLFQPREEPLNSDSLAQVIPRVEL